MSYALTTADGRTLSYDRAGSGPILVCHPGGPGGSGRYFGDLGGLARRATLIRLDPRGAGGSDRPADGSYLLEDYTADLEELRAHLGVKRVNVLGHSHGGFVAMVYAATYPERTGRLILLGTLARFSAEQREEKARSLAEKAADPMFADAVEARRARDAGDYADRAALMALLAREFGLYFARFGDAEREFVEGSMFADAFNLEALEAFNATVAPTFDLRPLLGRIVAPTLVLTGDGDYMAGVGPAEEIAADIAGSELEIVPAAGHFPWVEEPGRVSTMITAFLAAAA
ncbi:MAG: alpha/beta hydrolase [Gaiellaceae bacterium]